MAKKAQTVFSQVIETPVRDVGPVCLKQSSRAKQIRISIQPFKGVQISVPKGIPFERAVAFAETKTAWINRQLEKIKHIEGAIQNASARLDAIDRNAAKAALVRRLDHLSCKHNLPYHRVFIRSQKTRWASCSAKNNISLNIKLVLLKDALIDYVLLHELVHTRIKSHGKPFWVMLETIAPGAKQANKRLKAIII